MYLSYLKNKIVQKYDFSDLFICIFMDMKTSLYILATRFDVSFKSSQLGLSFNALIIS